MDYTITKRWSLFAVFWVALVFGLFPSSSFAQSGSYEVLPAPDLWYNSVDGVRIGVRLRGQQPGTFGDGPHRLNAGLWLGTKFPANPVSYYLSFTEPIPSLSDFGSEANVNLESQYRTGFQQHGISFNKRWQTGFDETNYKEFSAGLQAEHRFSKDYLLYSQLWQDEWLYLATADFVSTSENALGRSLFSVFTAANLAGEYEKFWKGGFSVQQRMALSKSFSLSGRFFTGFATAETAPEYLFMHSLKSARGWMSNGLTRARGTIPPDWMNSGNIQVSGGANLRGYTHQDILALNNGDAPLYTSISSVNVELSYPNPLGKALKKIPVLGEFITLESYLFYDGGTSLGLTSYEENRVLSDMGPGFLFSINIPDYLGKTRGLQIRYDLPLWLSHPGNEKSFKFRNIIGIGAVISL